MTRTDVLPETPAPPAQGAAEACPACGHPWRTHDVISTRYCAATTAGALTRRCICPRER
jgi:hypothetical protein